MLIVCPNCKKRFDVDPAAIGEARKLRCSSCKAIFRLVRKAQEGQATQPGSPQPVARPVEQPAQQWTPQPTQQQAEAAIQQQAAQRPVDQPLAGTESDLRGRNAAPTSNAGDHLSERVSQSAEGKPASGGIKVVVANESAAFCDAVQKVLSTEPFEVVVCSDGKVALETVEQIRPDVLLLDVALPTMFGFEVCERVRQNPDLAGVRIVLIASIYDKTRYKRSPNSLYGADDYIEKHHIPDSLVPMVYRLAAGGGHSDHASEEQERAARDEARSEIRQVEEKETSLPAAPAEIPVADPFAVPLQETMPQQEPVFPEWGTPEAGQAPDLQDVAPLSEMVPMQETVSLEEFTAPAEPVAPQGAELSEPEKKARRLARIIVSDIVLYNQGKVEQGVREGNFYQLLADDIREGQRLYRQRVSEELREKTDFLKDAFEDLIAKKRAELRI